MRRESLGTRAGAWFVPLPVDHTESELALGPVEPNMRDAAVRPEYGGRPVVAKPGVAGAMTDFGSGKCGANTGNASWSSDRSADRVVGDNSGELPEVNRVAGALTGRPECGALPVVSLSATTGKASWSLVRRCRSTRIWAFAGRPQSWRCRSSRIRALPVVANPGAAGRPTSSDHTESELALGPEHSPRDGDNWRNGPSATELLQR